MRRPAKLFQIKKQLSAVPRYGNNGTELIFDRDSNYDVYISNCAPQNGSDNVKINVLYCGNSEEIPNDIADKLLISHEASNSLQPYRWYKFTTEVANIGDPDDIHRVRKVSISHLLNYIDSPSNIWIFEVHYKEISNEYQGNTIHRTSK